GWVRGSTSRADLESGTYKPKLITVEDEVTGESHSVSAPEAWKLRAGWMEATISHAGAVEHVQTRKNVEIEKIAGDAHQRVNGNQIDAKFKNSKVDEIEAMQAARMIMGSGQTLESSRIWTNASGSMQTGENSILTVGDSTIQGREFTIQNGEPSVAFSTVRP